MTTDPQNQQALAAFIDSGNLEFEILQNGRWNKNEIRKSARWWIQEPKHTEDEKIRIAEDQLNPFGIPHSLAHLIHKPTNLSAEQITEDGKYRIALIRESKYGSQYFDGQVWVHLPPSATSPVRKGDIYTYRLPALHPLPSIRGIKDLPESTQTALVEMVQLAQKQMIENPDSFNDPAEESAEHHVATPFVVTKEMVEHFRSTFVPKVVSAFGYRALLSRMTVKAEQLERERNAARQEVLDLQAQVAQLREALIKSPAYDSFDQWVKDQAISTPAPAVVPLEVAEKMKEALNDIADPLCALQKQAVKDGARLNNQAFDIARDPMFLMGIAQKALAAFKPYERKETP